jgi:hypothetical protein
MAGAPQNQAKVLRIGIIMDGKIVQERLIKAGESVTIGDSPKNTFVLPKTSLPRQDFPIFIAKANKYYLHFTEQMKGKVGSGGAVVGLEKVRTDPSVEKEGAGWKLPLSEQDRGKVSIDNVTVLFQFVSAPPTASVKAPRVDFRPRLVEEDDALLFGFLALFSAIGLIFIIWVWNSEVVEITSVDQIDERWTKFIVEQPPEPVVTEVVQTDDGSKKEEKKEAKVESESEAKSNKPAKSAEERAAEAKAKVEKSVMLQFLTTRGDSSEGSAKDLWAEGDAGLKDLDAALAGATGVKAADENSRGLRGTGGGPGGDADIGEVGQIGGGNASVTEAPKVQVAVDVGEGEADEMEQGDQATVKKTVQRYAGQLKYCYESRLKANPDLGGRVEIEWNIAGGRVTSASVFANTTGDSELADCIVGKIKRWTFPTEIEGEVLWPFIFKQKT